jgi:hypothetical protein
VKRSPETQIKLLSENKLKIGVFVNLHYQTSREKFEPEARLDGALRRSEFTNY